jgi:hypothetical protein
MSAMPSKVRFSKYPIDANTDFYIDSCRSGGIRACRSPLAIDFCLFYSILELKVEKAGG